MKLASKYLVIILLLLFPLGLLVRLKLSTNVYIVPQDAVIFLLAIIVLMGYKKKGFFKDKFYTFQLLFLVVGLISLFINAALHSGINIVVALLYLLRYLGYLSLLKVAPYFEKSKRIIPIVYVSSFLFVVFGYLQFIFYNDMRKLFYLGWDEHLYRLFSTLFDPNFAGMCLVVIFFLFLRPGVSRKIEEGYLFIILSFFTAVAIFITYSRSALVSLVVGLITLGILHRKFKFLILFFLAGLILLLTVSDVSIEGLNPFRTVSTSGRIHSLKEAAYIFSKQPVVGVGFNTFRYAQLRYGMRTEAGIATSNSDAGTDNSFLFVAATTGIIGLIFFCLGYFSLLRDLFRENVNSNSYTIAVVIGIIFGSMFLNILFYTPFLIIFFLYISLRKKLS